MMDESGGITRRKVLAGAGGAASLGVLATQTGCTERMSGGSVTWDQVTDVIVVGTGIGGATAALTAKDNGDDVIIVDKAGFFGGTSSKTAAVICCRCDG